MNELDSVAIRVEGVEAAGTIAVGLGLGFHGYFMLPQVLFPFIDIAGGVEENPEMIESRILSRRVRRALVKCEVVPSAREVTVV